MSAKHVEFKSAFPLAESVDRLKAATRRWTFSLSAMAHESAVRRVSAQRVALQRVIPMFSRIAAYTEAYNSTACSACRAPNQPIHGTFLAHTNLNATHSWHLSVIHMVDAGGQLGTSACYRFAADAGSSREAPATFPWDRSSLNFSMSLSKNFGGNSP